MNADELRSVAAVAARRVVDQERARGVSGALVVVLGETVSSWSANLLTADDDATREVVCHVLRQIIDQIEAQAAMAFAREHPEKVQ
jgi:hypothetical protein